REHLLIRAQQAAQISSKPIYVLREVLRYLSEQQLVSPGYTFLQEDIVGKALTAEQTCLTAILQACPGYFLHPASNRLIVACIPAFLPTDERSSQDRRISTWSWSSRAK
ncbi:MAG TPA: hypothetical protein VLA19_30555, partial [Herpetosiphonaceae bacterium]|nr:hypothetical protein [Herpetosiphonaceae bacterium]